MRYIIAAIDDLADAAKGQVVAPFDAYRRGIASLHLVGREGVSMSAVSGPVLAEPFELKDGNLIVPDRSGQGIEWDEKAVAGFTL